MKKNAVFFLFFILLLAAGPSRAAFSGEEPRRDYAQAVLQGQASNVLVWGFDLLVLQAGYARISLESWEKNLREGFEWDNSQFHTNQILHPYQGGTYYNAARVNGFSFWESIPFTVFGSLVWEYFCERENPSVNDLITTSFGGVAMGEAGFRLSTALIDGRETGARRVAREIAALILNPVLAFNRLLYGDTILRGLSRNPQRVELTLYSGINRTRDDYALFEVTPHPFAGFLLRFGNPYGPQEVYAPYDYFVLQAGLDMDISNPGGDVFAHAVLYGRRLYPGGESRALAGFFQHFDYLENYEYKFAANGAGAGFELDFPFLDDHAVDLRLHLYGIALGGVDSRYSNSITGRDYSLGPGGGFKSELRYTYLPLFSLAVKYNFYWFHTSSGSDTENAVSFFSALAEVPVKDDLTVGVEFHMYDRWSDAGYDSAHSFGLRSYLAFAL